MTKVIIKKSDIDKKGVFAIRDIRKGEIILKWNPMKLTKDELRSLTAKEKHYLLKIGPGSYLMQEPERYVNHSCEANTVVKNLSDVASRNIKKGEEITSDYTKDSTSTLSFSCKCGNKKCRGYIK